MAHTITLCPRCGNDFMYHSTDSSSTKLLLREITGDSGEVEDYEVICQDCDYFEKFGGDLFSELGDLEVNYENFKNLVSYYWEEGDVNELKADGYIIEDREKSTESVIYYRYLTETEFRTRVLKEKL